MKDKKDLKIYTSPYQLKFKTKNKYGDQLRGTLLAFDFDSDLRGYADFLPWHRFGEKKLELQLEEIKQGKISQRFLIAKRNAWLDANARFKKQNLFFGLTLPPSHFLIEDILSFSSEEEIVKWKHQYVKVKLHPHFIPNQIKTLKRLYQNLPREIKWRLDLNSQRWSLWKEGLSFMKERIDFIEDPLIDNQKILEEDRKLFAEDWITNDRFQIRVAKPSRDWMEDLDKGLSCSRWKRIIFTQSFDHPLGEAAAAYWAAKFYQKHPRLFEVAALKGFKFTENKFYFHHAKNSSFEAPKGFGFGFDKLLEKENWKRLV